MRRLHLPYLAAPLGRQPSVWRQELRRCAGPLAIATLALTCLGALLAGASTISATAGPKELPYRVGLVARPYWETELNGNILALAIADLDGDGQGEILVGLEQSGNGELAVLNGDGSVEIRLPTQAPVGAIATLAGSASMPTPGSPTPILVVISQGDAVHAFDNTTIMSQSESLPSVPIARWVWPPQNQSGKSLRAESQADGVARLFTVDVNGDGNPEIVRTVVSSTVALDSYGQVIPIPHAPAGITALGAVAGNLLIGTPYGAVLYGTKGGEPMPRQICAQGPVNSLAGVMSGTVPIVIAGCEDSVEVYGLDNQNIWSHTITAPPIARVQILSFTADTSASILLELSNGVAVLDKGEDFIQEVRFDSGGVEGISASGDVNGDGATEIVLAAMGALRLYGYGPGRLEFGLRAVAPRLGNEVGDEGIGSEPEILNIQDDDQFDLARIASVGGRITVQSGLKPPRPVLLPQRITDLESADLNGDKTPDIVIVREDGLYVAYTDAESKRPLPVQTIATVTDTVFLAVDDLSGDEVPEIVARRKDGSLVVLSQVKSHTVETRWTATTVLTQTGMEPIVADVKGDSRPEIVVVRNPSTQLSAFSLKQNGHIVELIEDPNWKPSLNAIKSLNAGDVDDDQKLEIIAVTEVATDSEKKEGKQFLVVVLDGNRGEISWQQQVGEIAAVTTADLDGNGKLEMLVGAKDGSVYAVRNVGNRSAPFAPSFTVDSKVIGLAVADVNQSPGSEVILGTSNSNISILQAHPNGSLARVYSYTLPVAIAAMFAVDMEHDGISEIAVTTKEGVGYLFGLTLNQRPLLVNAMVSGDEAARAYSVTAFDPEDEFKACLEVPHPSKLPFLLQRASHLGGCVRYSQPGAPQRLDWLTQPFDLLDIRLPTQYYVRANYLEASTSESILLGPWAGPVVSTPIWFQIASVVALIGLVASIWIYDERRQHHLWVESPAGQAATLFKDIQASPTTILHTIGKVTVQPADSILVLNQLQALCESRKCQAGWSKMAQGYALILGGPAQWDAGLRTLEEGLDLAPNDVTGRQEAIVACRFLTTALNANSVSRIAALKSRPDAPQLQTPAGIPGLLNLNAVLPEFARIAELVDNSQRFPGSEARLYYLNRAVTSLNQFSQNTGSPYQQPAGPMLAEIVSRWLGTVSNAVEELRGRAELGVSMPTRRIMASQDVRLALKLYNEGKAEAANVKVELLPSPQYQLLEGDGTCIGSILPSQSKSVEFSLRPLAVERFLAEFSISYDDERSKGRNKLFSDQVLLIPTPEDYRPIRNPYQPGLPLPQGSPLFFGREDVFAFIASNLGGPAVDNVLVLIGQRRTGKTSLLRQLPLKLERRYVPVFVDGQQLGADPGMDIFYYGLSATIAQSLAESGIDIALPSREDFKPAPSQVFELEFLKKVDVALGDRRLLLSFDEFEEIESRVKDGNLDRTVFQFLRHLMQHTTKLAFIFVGTHKLEELTKDYWSIFFNIALHKQIRFLDDDVAQSLIREPIADSGLVYDDLAVKYIVDVTAGHPYFLQLVCHAVINFANLQRRSYITVEDVRNVIKETISLGEAHFGSLWNLSSPNEQLVLSALAALLRDEALVSAGAISNALAAHRLPMDPAQVSEILGRLAAQDLVDEIGEIGLQYRFKMEIVRLWIVDNRPLSRVVEDLTVRAAARKTAELGEQVRP